MLVSITLYELNLISYYAKVGQLRQRCLVVQKPTEANAYFTWTNTETFEPIVPNVRPTLSVFPIVQEKTRQRFLKKSKANETIGQRDNVGLPTPDLNILQFGPFHSLSLHTVAYL